LGTFLRFDAGNGGAGVKKSANARIIRFSPLKLVTKLTTYRLAPASANCSIKLRKSGGIVTLNKKTVLNDY
jgi:hypothetical protein